MCKFSIFKTVVLIKKELIMTEKNFNDIVTRIRAEHAAMLKRP